MSKTPSFEDHIGLLKSIVHSFDGSCPPEDSDLFPVACIGMMKAIETFDPARAKFSYWATKIIRNMLLSEKRRVGLRCVPMSSLGVREDSVLDHRSEEFPLDLVSALTEPCPSDTSSDLEHKNMLRRHFVDEVSMAEIAREVGITREGVRQKIKRAVEFVRKKSRDSLENHPSWLAGRDRSSSV